VDLFGQANAEFIGERQVSSTAGSSTSCAGARLSPGGTPILSLKRHRPGRRDQPASCRAWRRTPSRSPAPTWAWVVTEHGSADLRDLPLDARAEALIGVASPAHRAALATDMGAHAQRCRGP
jgi:acyl-CoA hydrolase